MYKTKKIKFQRTTSFNFIDKNTTKRQDLSLPEIRQNWLKLLPLFINRNLKYGKIFDQTLMSYRCFCRWKLLFNFFHLKRLQIRRDHDLLKSVNKEEKRVNIQESINEESLN